MLMKFKIFYRRYENEVTSGWMTRTERAVRDAVEEARRSWPRSEGMWIKTAHRSSLLWPTAVGVNGHTAVTILPYLAR